MLRLISRPSLSPSRQALAILLVCLPPAVVLAGLVGLGVLGLGTALLALLVMALIAWPLVRLYLGDIAAFGNFIAGLADGGEPPRPRFELAVVVDELSAAASALHRGWLEQQRALAALASSSQRILDGLPDPLIAVDRARRISQINARARALFGVDGTERNVAVVLRQPQLLAALDAALQRRQSATVELVLSGKVERILQAHVAPLSDDSDGKVAALMVFHDVTALRRSEQMRGDFVANASHELKTPISTLIGFIETLRGPARDDKDAHERFLKIMDEQAQRMARLVNDLLSLSDIELREHSRPSGTVDMAALARSVMDMFELRARQRGQTLKLEVEPDLPPVAGDRDELAQVLQNLIDNAIKYNRAGQPVTVGLARVSGAPAGVAGGVAGAMVAVEVRDRGEGIPPQHLSRLTERFYRVDTARSRELGGTGLGLAIVKHIVNRHRGSLEIASTVGEGSRFTVRLPLAAPAVAGQDGGRAVGTATQRHSA
jgi:two-component system phosphate regulon sensor histidine kinase PhoR